MLILNRLLHRQFERECAAFAEFALNGYVTAMRLGNVLDNGQPEPGAA
jgi:hypothetical protein